jgi:hypothetical protein
VIKYLYLHLNITKTSFITCRHYKKFIHNSKIQKKFEQNFIVFQPVGVVGVGAPPAPLLTSVPGYNERSRLNPGRYLIYS